jgi:hypothetical protein
MTRKRSNSTDAILKELRAFGLTYPGTAIKSPWPDHADLAVNGKTFAYLSLEGEPFKISLRPRSSPPRSSLSPCPIERMVSVDGQFHCWRTLSPRRANEAPG